MSESSQLVRVFIPDVKAQKCIVLNVMDTVWTAKQVILDKVYQELTLNPLNYGLYFPSTGQGKPGKFMVDNNLLIDYALEGNVPKLELRYKKRDYTGSLLTDKAIVKANNRANQRKLLECISSGSVKRIEKLLDSGLDPNFATEDGNTPLGLACGRNSNSGAILPLITGGAHIDFRGKDGLTPMHRAAIGGNAQAINILLSFDASPNYRDAKGLTPLYHTAIMGDDAGSCISLLRYRAEIGIRDQGGWTELHHTAKYGHVEHANLLIRYGADINAQNLVGNTALHVAASHGQTDFAKMLLKRGADKLKLNFANQTPSQVSVLCGQHHLASEINAFTADSVEPITLPPDYNPKAKKENKLYDVRRVSDICPTRPPTEEIVGTLAVDWNDQTGVAAATVPLGEFRGDDQTSMLEHPKMAQIRKGSNSSSVSSQQGRGLDTSGGDADSVNSVDMGSNHSGSTVGTPTMGTPTMGTPRTKRPSFQQQRERLYRAGPEQYIVTQDVDAQQPGDLTLRKGMSVQVTYIGRGGFWEGRAEGKEGWFPRLAIKELGDEEFDYSTLTRDSKLKKTVPSGNPEVAMQSSTMDIASLCVEEQHQSPPEAEPSPPPDSSPYAHHKFMNTLARVVNVVRGSRGYGFAMRGVKATKAMKFHPTPEVPSLQYVGNVEEGGAAAMAGLKPGDFIVEVNGIDTTYSTHDEVVSVVRKSGGTLKMRVITPVIKPKSVSMQIRSHLTPVSTPDMPQKQSQQQNPKQQQPQQQQQQQIPQLQQQQDSPRAPKFSKSTAAHDSPRRRPGVSGGAGLNAEVGTPVSRLGKGRETVIGEDSPSIPRKGNFEWDSHGEESPGLHRRDDHHRHSTGSSSSNSSSPSKASPSRSKSFAGLGYSSGRSPPRILQKTSPSLPTMFENPPHHKTLGHAQTLPANVQASNLSDFASQNSQEEEEEESSFALALKKSRQNLMKSPSHNPVGQKSPSVNNSNNSKNSPFRTRANTLPNKDDGVSNAKASEPSTEEDSLSSLQKELRRANEERNKRMSLNQEKVSDLGKKEPEKRATLTKVLSEKFDDMHLRMKSPDVLSDNSSDFDDGPIVVPKMPMLKAFSLPTGDLYSGSKSPGKSRVPPPTVKPKPTKKKTETSIGSISEIPNGALSDDTLPKLEDDGGENSKGSVFSDSVFDVKLRSVPTKKESISNTATSSKTISSVLSGSADSKKVPPVVAPKKGKKMAPPEEGKTDSIPSQDPPDGFLLPPPLDESEEDRRFSFVNLDPPDDFNFEPEASKPPSSVTSSKLPPPPGSPPPPPPPPPLEEVPDSTKLPFLPPSSPPPPPPLSDPPPKEVSTSPEVFIFESKEPAMAAAGDLAAASSPITVPSSTLAEPDSQGITLPSPIPSPTSKRLSNLSTSPLPPPAFGSHNSSSEQEGFWISDENTSTEAQSTIPPFSPSSDVSEVSEIPPPLPSEPPPPLPSEPPPTLDSDTSAENSFSPVAEVCQNGDVSSSDVPSSSGTSPVSYTVSAAHVKEDIEVKEEENNEPPAKVAIKNSKEPTKEFLVPDVNEKEELKPNMATTPTTPSLTPTLTPTLTPAAAPSTPVLSGYKSLPLSEWNTDDVCQWLRDLGLSDHVESFIENEMMGEHLLDITRDDLKELGVKKMGHQKTILSRLSQLSK